jgi:PAS domain S-box-containing protein
MTLLRRAALLGLVCLPYACGHAEQPAAAVAPGTVVAEAPVIRVGSELDFRPYAFVDDAGQAAGFSPELIKAVANAMGLRLHIATDLWDNVWNGLVAGQFDVLPTVARTPGRESLVDFSLPHTETFDAFFVRQGRPPFANLAAAAGKEIVVLREDAAHHQLNERKFPGKVIPVESIPDGLRLIAAGKYDALLCSKLIATLEMRQYDIRGLTAGPPIPDYKRVFSFAVHKGNTELLEKFNEGLRIVKATGEYDRLYRKWLGVELEPQSRWWAQVQRFLTVLAGLGVCAVAWRLWCNAAVWDARLLWALAPRQFAALPTAWRYALALVIVAVAMALRMALIPWLGTAVLHSVAIPAIVATVVLLGSGPGSLAMVLLILGDEGMVLGSFATPWTGVTSARIGASLLAGGVVVGILHAARVAAFQARQSAERLAELGAATFEGIVESEAGRIVDCNEQFAQMMGRSITELKGMAIADLIAPEDRERVAANIRGNRESVIEHVALRKDGTRIVIEAHGRSVAMGGTRRHTAVRDITESKQAEEALQELKTKLEQRVAEQTAEVRQVYETVKTERKRLYDVLETLPVYVVLLSKDYHVPFANKFFRERFGESGGKRCFEYLFNRGEACENCESYKAMKTGSPHHWYWTGPDGRDYDIYDFPFTDSDGSPMIMEMGIDITEVKKAQTALQQLNATLEQRVAERTAELADLADVVAREKDRLAALLNSITDEIWFADAAAKFTLVNPSGVREFMLDAAEPSDVRNLAKSLEVLRPDGSPRPAEEAPPLRALRGEVVRNQEEIIRTPTSGELRHRQVSSSPVRDAGGNIIGSVSVVRDVTELKRAEEAVRLSEQKFSAAFANNPAAITLSRLEDGIFLDVNDTWVALTGYRRDEAIGLSAQIPPIWPTVEAAARFVQELREEGSLHGWEQEFQKKSGEIFVAQLSAQLLAVQGENVILSTLVDITARKRAEEEIRRRMEELRVANEELASFNEVAVGRELRMIELKKEVNAICTQLGKPAKYDVEEEEE